ncbi:hypothetical protein LJC47_03615 [Desulfosarcina sp. OttesenSCG-928-B08]|nr:hypothetical protein [Desulfosarcina sp. OttesenSCG-928-B08]
MRATPQNFVEFWNVATRPIEKNGFGLMPANTDRLLGLWSDFSLCCQIRLRYTLNGVALSFPSAFQVSKYMMPELSRP